MLPEYCGQAGATIATCDGTEFDAAIALPSNRMRRDTLFVPPATREHEVGSIEPVIWFTLEKELESLRVAESAAE